MAKPFDSVFVDIGKLQYYCLSDIHPRGRHKARVFQSRLGLSAKDAPQLQLTLLRAARDQSENLRAIAGDSHGQRYILDFDMQTPAGTARLRSAWIVLKAENVLRFVSCYVL